MAKALAGEQPPQHVLEVPGGFLDLILQKPTEGHRPTTVDVPEDGESAVGQKGLRKSREERPRCQDLPACTRSVGATARKAVPCRSACTKAGHQEHDQAAELGARGNVVCREWPVLADQRSLKILLLRRPEGNTQP